MKRGAKSKLKKDDLKESNMYVLSILGLVFALIIPIYVLISVIIVSLPQNQIVNILAYLIVGLFFPLLAIIFGTCGLLKSIKSKTRIGKTSRILSIIALIVGVILAVFSAYTFINPV